MFSLRKVRLRGTFSVCYRCKSTIFALSTGYVKSGVAVLRVSGKSCQQVIYSMTNFKTLPKPRTAYLKSIHDPNTKETLDKGLLLWFPGPNSFTGEDMCEFQVHGSKAVIQAIITALTKLTDLRPAEPGEFTKRAFLAGKFDLTEVEGLSDLIDAETEFQRKQALHQMEGSLGKMYLSWRKIILKNLALVEAFIDFGEDNNIEEDILSKVNQSLQKLSTAVKVHLNDFRKGEILRDGIKTVIVGSPNVGKSSLLNILCERPAAIVTEIAGTTRDVIQTTLNINGYPVLLSDTAGIRKVESDIVEREGIKRSISEASEANLLLILLDIQNIFFREDISSKNFEDKISMYCSSYQRELGIQDIKNRTNHIILANKGDLLKPNELELIENKNIPNFLIISCKTQKGISKLLEHMSQHFKKICGVPDKMNPVCSRNRHRYHLNECIVSLDKYLNSVQGNTAIEECIVIAAENLRTAAEHLGMITGTIATDEVLGIIFKRFCIGK